MQKFSKYGTFKFKDFSRTFKGLEFFPQIQGLSRTSQGPYKPCVSNAVGQSPKTS